MQALFSVYQYEPTAYQKLVDSFCGGKEKKRFGEYFLLTYDSLRNARNESESCTVRRFMNDWEGKTILEAIEHSKKSIPVRLVRRSNSNFIHLNHRYFRRKSKVHMITSKKGLYDFMNRYVKKESFTSFVHSFITPFIEGEMVLKIVC